MASRSHPRVRRTVLLTGAAATLACLAIGGCSSDSAGPPPTQQTRLSVQPIPEGKAPLLIDQIAPAIAALEARLGGPQQYFEVNATPTLVNLFVATDGGTKAVAYVYATGQLHDPAPAQPASGPTFPAGAIHFDGELVLATIVQQLPDSELRLFSISGATAAITVTVDSSQGTEFLVYVDGNGTILGTDQSLLGSPDTAGS